MSKRPTAVLDAALRYVEAGLALIPLKGKAPASQLLPRDSDGAPSVHALAAEPATEREVRAWFAAMPSANVGVITGAGVRPVLGVDLDPAKCDDPERGALLRAQGGPTRELMPGVVLPPSPLQVLSGSRTGGRHLYYSHPPNQVRCVTRVGHPAGGHVDLQAEGRYLVLPPSIHPESGQPYLWVDGEDRLLSTDDVVALLTTALPQWPRWAIRSEADDRHEPEAPRVQAGQWITAAWSHLIPEGGGIGGTGGRKQTLRSLVQYYARQGLPVDVAIAQLQSWNAQVCRPPLDAQEVNSIAHWIYDRVHEESAQGIADRVHLRLRGPQWPHDLFLGTRFGRWTEAVAASRGTHPDLVALCGLGALGAASTGAYRLHYLEPGITLDDHHWVAPSALWVMPIMESGARKSAAYRVVEPILQGTNDPLAIVALRYNAEREAHLEDLKLASKAAMARMGDEREAATDARREITRRISEVPAPLGDRWLLSEATPEAFLRSLAEAGHLAMLSEEGDETIAKFFGHYSGSADMNGVLKSWDGGVTIQSRIGRGVTEVRGVASILAMVQPRVLSQLGGANAEDRGLMARFLFAAPPPQEISDAPVTEITKAAEAKVRAEMADALRAIYYGGTLAAAEAVERAEAYRPAYEHDPNARPCEIPDDLTPARGRPRADFCPPAPERLVRPDPRESTDVLFQGECIVALQKLEADLKAAAVEGGEHFTARTWTRKAHEHAMRIAAVLQLSESPPRDHETVIMDIAWVNRAIALVRQYFVPHYYIAKDLIDSPPYAELGLHILTHFADRDAFSVAEAAALVSKRTPDIKPVVEWLERVGAVRIGAKGKIYPLPNVTY